MTLIKDIFSFMLFCGAKVVRIVISGKKQGDSDLLLKPNLVNIIKISFDKPRYFRLQLNRLIDFESKSNSGSVCVTPYTEEMVEHSGAETLCSGSKNFMFAQTAILKVSLTKGTQEEIIIYSSPNAFRELRDAEIHSALGISQTVHVRISEHPLFFKLMGGRRLKIAHGGGARIVFVSHVPETPSTRESALSDNNMIEYFEFDEDRILRLRTIFGSGDVTLSTLSGGLLQIMEEDLPEPEPEPAVPEPVTTGSDNVAIGHRAGLVTSGGGTPLNYPYAYTIPAPEIEIGQQERIERNPLGFCVRLCPNAVLKSEFGGMILVGTEECLACEHCSSHTEGFVSCIFGRERPLSELKELKAEPEPVSAWLNITGPVVPVDYGIEPIQLEIAEKEITENSMPIVETEEEKGTD